MEKQVTLRDIYDAVNSLRFEIDNKFIKFEKKVDLNTAFRNQLIGKLTVLFVVVGAGINWVWDVFTSSKIKGG